MIKRGLVNDLPTAGRALVRSMVLIAAAAVAMVSGGSVFAAEPLTVFEWSGYEDPEFHKSYTEKYGGSPKYAFYVEEEEGFQKLRAGYRADIAHPCTLSTKKWKDAGLIKPIDTSRIKAWDNVIPELRKIDGVEIDGKVYMVPVDWGNTAVIYRTDQVKLDNKSIKFLTDP
ncbi:MAG: hypothetical protein OEU09_11590, partial [Rhodospirillales bacterium]|nr:hypothetical protein [Rhodospirillales bacterium]